MAANYNHNYSMSDFGAIMSDLTSGGMSLENTVFGHAKDPSQYDAIAATANYAQNAMMGKYIDQMTNSSVIRRQAALQQTLGLGQLQMSALNTAMGFDRNLGYNLLGHHGAEFAAQKFLMSSGSIAAARGLAQGGVMDPYSMSQNMMFAASQGGLAYNNNFNKDGSLNISQTHGLNLPTASLISAAALSERSQYDSWARNAKANLGSNGMTSEEIDNFKNGVGSTKNAQESFNKHIKDFTEQINGFVSSVSKMTGSCDTAIDFMQQMTHGKLFKAGEDADKARENASRMAMSMRVAAADAGMSPQLFYGMTKQFAGNMSAALGVSPILGGNSASQSVAALAAAGLADWRKNNPYASAEEAARAQRGMELKVAGYAEGDSRALNILAADLIADGAIDRGEWEKLAKSGNANAQFEYLSKFTGGRDNLKSMMKDGRSLMLKTMQNSALVEELHSMSFGPGMARESTIRGQRHQLDAQASDFAALMAGGDRQKFIKNSQEVRGMMRGAMLDTETLRKAGLSDDDIEEVQKKGKKMRVEDLRRLIARKGGDEQILNEEAAYSMLDQAEAKYGKDSKEVARLRKGIDRIYGGRTTEKDLGRAAEKIANDNRTKDIRDKFAGILALPEKERASAIAKYEKDTIDSALKGENGMTFETSDYIEQLIADNVTGKDEEKDKKIAEGKEAFYSELNKSGDIEKAYSALEKKLGTGKLGFDARKKAYERTKLANQRSKGLAAFSNVTGIEFSEKEATKLYRDMDALRKEHPEMSEDDIFKIALEKSGKITAEFKDKDNLKYAMGLADAQEASTNAAADATMEYLKTGVRGKASKEEIDRVRKTTSYQELRYISSDTKLSDEQKELTGAAAAGSNSEKASAEARAKATTNGSVINARDRSKDNLTIETGKAADQKSAEAYGRQIGKLNPRLRDIVKETMKTDDILKYIDNGAGNDFDKALENGTISGNADISERRKETIAKLRQALADPNTNIDDFLKKNKDNDITNAIEELKANSKENNGVTLTSREALKGLVAGYDDEGRVIKDEKKRGEARKDAMATERILSSGSGKGDNEQLSSVLFLIYSLLQQKLV